MAKHRRHGHHKKKVPMFATSGALMQGLRLYTDYNAAPVGKKGDTVLANMGIVKGSPFVPMKFLGYWTPVLAGAVLSAGASNLGLNKYMSRVPGVNF